MGKSKGIKNTAVHIWSNEEKEYLAEITPGHHYTEIQELMKNKFNLEFTMNQIKGAICRYKLNTGFTGRYKKGNVPFNKGRKGSEYLTEKALEGMRKTQFKKGQAPINWRPVGSERITKDGYIEIKIAEPSVWELKHKVLWEKENGSVPKGHALIFADGDKTNISLDNLLLVTRNQLLVMNRNKLIKNNSEATKTGVLIAEVLIKANERRKETNDSNS